VRREKNCSHLGVRVVRGLLYQNISCVVYLILAYCCCCSHLLQICIFGLSNYRCLTILDLICQVKKKIISGHANEIQLKFHSKELIVTPKVHRLIGTSEHLAVHAIQVISNGTND
jgi:hypothetical protein